LSETRPGYVDLAIEGHIQVGEHLLQTIVLLFEIALLQLENGLFLVKVWEGLKLLSGLLDLLNEFVEARNILIKQKLAHVHHVVLNLLCLELGHFDDPLVVLVDAIADVVAAGRINAAISVLVAFEPRPTVRGDIRLVVRLRHVVDAIPLSLVSREETFVASAISPGVNAESSNFPVDPFTSELAAVIP